MTLLLPPFKLLLLGLMTTFLSIFSFGLQFSVTGLTLDILRNFINDSIVKQSHPASSESTHQEIDLILGSIVAAPLLSSAFGALFAIPMADRFGRRMTLFIINNFILILSSLILALSKLLVNWQILMASRLVLGITMGISLTLIPVYLTECSPIRFRGFLGALHSPMVYLSMLIGVIFSFKQIMGNMEKWHFLYGAGAVPAAVQICFYSFVPETPEFDYIKRKNGAKAAATIRKFFGSDYAEPESPLIEETLQMYDMQKHSADVSILTILTRRSKLHIIFLALCLGISRPATGEFVILTYLEDNLREYNISAVYHPTIGTCLTGTSLLSSCLGTFLVEYVGRRKLLIPCLLTSLICWLLICILDLINFKIKSVKLALLMINYGVYPIGCATVTWFMASEICYQPERAAVSSICLFAGTLLLWFSTFIYPTMVSWNSVATYCVLYISPLVVVIYVFWFHLPETRNRPIVDIVRQIEDSNWFKFPCRGKIDANRSKTRMERKNAEQLIFTRSNPMDERRPLLVGGLGHCSSI